jgi:hypothetical protein
MRKLLLIVLLFVAANVFGQIVPGVWRNEYGGEFTIVNVRVTRLNLLKLNTQYVEPDARILCIIAAGNRDAYYYTVQQINDSTWLLTSVIRSNGRGAGGRSYSFAEYGRPFWIQRVQ